jgi:hypothetical protein
LNFVFYKTTQAIIFDKYYLDILVKTMEIIRFSHSCFQLIQEFWNIFLVGFVPDVEEEGKACSACCCNIFIIWSQI